MAGIKVLNFLTFYDEGDDVGAGSKDYASQLAAGTGFNQNLAQITRKFALLFKTVSGSLTDTLNSGLFGADQLTNQSITASKLGADVAGSGLNGGNGNPINVNPGQGIGINGTGQVVCNYDPDYYIQSPGGLFYPNPSIYNPRMILPFLSTADGWCGFQGEPIGPSVGVPFREPWQLKGFSVSNFNDGNVESYDLDSLSLYFAANDRLQIYNTGWPVVFTVYRNGSIIYTRTIGTQPGEKNVIVLDFAKQ